MRRDASSIPRVAADRLCVRYSRGTPPSSNRPPTSASNISTPTSVTYSHFFRVRQHEAIQQVRLRLAPDRHPEPTHVREVRLTQLPQLPRLLQIHLPAQALVRLPAPEALLQRSQVAQTVRVKSKHRLSVDPDKKLVTLAVLGDCADESVFRPKLAEGSDWTFRPEFLGEPSGVREVPMCSEDAADQKAAHTASIAKPAKPKVGGRSTTFTKIGRHCPSVEPILRAEPPCQPKWTNGRSNDSDDGGVYYESRGRPVGRISRCATGGLDRGGASFS